MLNNFVITQLYKKNMFFVFSLMVLHYRNDEKNKKANSPRWDNVPGAYKVSAGQTYNT